MDQLTLYRVIGGQKRIALGDLADGVEFFTAESNPVGHADGTIILTPVNVVGSTARRTEEDATEPAPFD